MIWAVWSNLELGISNQHQMMAGLTRCSITAGPSPGTRGELPGNTWWSALSLTVPGRELLCFPRIEKFVICCYHYHRRVTTVMLLHLAQSLSDHTVSHHHHLRWGEGQLPISWAPLTTCHQKIAQYFGSIWAKLANRSPINFLIQRMSLFVVWNVNSNKNVLIIQLARATSLVFMGDRTRLLPPITKCIHELDL